MDFSKIAGSKNASKFSGLLKAFDRTSDSKKKTYGDEDYWYPQRDKAGNAKAVIRFLPGLESENGPCFIELYNHFFKTDTGKFYIANCPTTIEKDCPACASNRDFVEAGGGWKELGKKQKDFVRNRKRKQQFHCNILVVDDPANPENNGKVFKFKFGKKILEKIMSLIDPEFDDVEPINPFDYKEGSNFRMSVRKYEGFVNYDLSSFAAKSALKAAVIKQCEEESFPIMPLIATEAFEEYEALEKKFIKATSKTGAVVPDEEESPGSSFAELAGKVTKKDPVKPDVEQVDTTTGDDVPMFDETATDEDDYFQRLANDVS